MRSTFNLKEPNKNGLTSIRLVAYFKNENKRFVYSTGESIHPKDWDFKYLQPKHLNGRTKLANEMRSIKSQIDRYSDLFLDLTNRYRIVNEELTIAIVRRAFDKEFKRVKTKSTTFFEVYDSFIEEKRNDRTSEGNSESTIKRYEYNKKLLEDFEAKTNHKISFQGINQSFYDSLIEYCIDIKKHSVNTLSRNMGLLKSFLNWSLENGYTFKDDFKKFKNIKKEITQEIALTLDQVKEVYNHDFSKNKRWERVRDVFVLGCTTGLRYSNLVLISKSDVYDGHIHLRDKKNKDKLLTIPLNDLSQSILKKYNYRIPKIANQKFNEYIKEVFQELKYNQPIKKSSRIGNTIVETELPMHDRISSHTARRSFITIMKNQKIPDKVIMSFTGHKSLEVFNKYYKPNEEDKKEFMQSVWKL
ncbi:tyrosine-type recombinase/integrase [Aegicerativicinus sediminis]|uniref:tyrosine-type recombinase/integrase n=1 Tax=Aegicerativicinus sediminis TaxID=2893202 RepID=UPI001E5B6759|nr:tyrosine-type recombinase/integrase [Aegicerativicinus sediminis]